MYLEILEEISRLFRNSDKQLVNYDPQLGKL